MRLSIGLAITARASFRNFSTVRHFAKYLPQQNEHLNNAVASRHRGLATSTTVRNAGDDQPAQHAQSQLSERIPIKLSDNVHEFDAAYLRDSCSCAQCRDPDSKQKLFQTSDIPVDIKGRLQHGRQDGDRTQVTIEWDQDIAGSASDHRSHFPLSWLKEGAGVKADHLTHIDQDPRVLWNKSQITDNSKWVDYEDWLAIDEPRKLLHALEQLHRYGLLFIRNVPDSEDSVIRIANRIGTLKDTFYGRTWDVRSKPNAENIAYTPGFLGLHMDLLYTSNPPHLQLLHSLRARTPGGESFFSDSFHAAEYLRQKHPEHFDILTKTPVTYRYHHKEHHYHYIRRTIETAASSSAEEHAPVTRVNWSPPFQGHFDQSRVEAAGTSLQAYIAAAHAFDTLLSSEDNVFEYRLNEGDCVIFDNRRVLHARRAFDPSKGERWLKGAYVDDDVFYSKLRVLREMTAQETEA